MHGVHEAVTSIWPLQESLPVEQLQAGHFSDHFQAAGKVKETR